MLVLQSGRRVDVDHLLGGIAGVNHSVSSLKEGLLLADNSLLIFFI